MTHVDSAGVHMWMCDKCGFSVTLTWCTACMLRFKKHVWDGLVAAVKWKSQQTFCKWWS